MSKKFNGIKDLRPTEPVGCILSIGKKSDRGFPTMTDRFHIVTTMQDANKIRQPHPAFSSFNAAPPEKRKVIRANLVHATKEDCFEFSLRAQTLGGKQHPNKRPMCTGDGVIASRYADDPSDPNLFNDITCANEKCEFRLGDKPMCKPFARLLFRPQWPAGVAFPTPLTKFSTGAWSTCSNMVGFFDYIENVAKHLGLKEYSLFGFAFMLTLAKKTNPSKKTSYPVVTMSPEIDPVSFFTLQQQNFEQLSGSATMALTDMQDDSELLADTEHLSLPSK